MKSRLSGLVALSFAATIAATAPADANASIQPSEPFKLHQPAAQGRHETASPAEEDLAFWWIWDTSCPRGYVWSPLRIVETPRGGRLEGGFCARYA